MKCILCVIHSLFWPDSPDSGQFYKTNQLTTSSGSNFPMTRVQVLFVLIMYLEIITLVYVDIPQLLPVSCHFCRYPRLFFNIWRTSVVFVGPLISLFCTYGYVCLVSKPGWIPLLVCFIACMQGIPQIHLWCDTCWPLDGQHGSRACLIHILVHVVFFHFQDFSASWSKIDIPQYGRQNFLMRRDVILVSSILAINFFTKVAYCLCQ